MTGLKLAIGDIRNRDFRIILEIINMIEICKIMTITLFLICFTGCHSAQNDIIPPLMDNSQFRDFKPNTNVTEQLTVKVERSAYVVF